MKMCALKDETNERKWEDNELKMYKLHGKCVFRNNLPKKKSWISYGFSYFHRRKSNDWWVLAFTCVCTEMIMAYCIIWARANITATQNDTYASTFYATKKKLYEWITVINTHFLRIVCTHFGDHSLTIIFLLHNEKLCPFYNKFMLAACCFCFVWCVSGAIFGFLLKIVPLSKK